MALRTPLSVTPHLYMGDSTGRPLDMGTVYFGEQDKDPEFYPINLFSDDALTKPLMQPVHTKGGYLYDKGDMVEPHAKEIIYSVKVLDSYGRKVFYKGAMMRNSWNDDVIEQINEAIVASAELARQVATDITNEAINNTAIEGGVLADTFVVVDGSLSQRTINKGLESIADLSTINNPKDGLRVYVKSYHAGLGKGGGYFTYTTSNISARVKADPAGGMYIPYPSGSDGSAGGFVREYDGGSLKAVWFGVKTVEGFDNTTAIRGAIVASISTELLSGGMNPSIEFPAGRIEFYQNNLLGEIDFASYGLTSSYITGIKLQGQGIVATLFIAKPNGSPMWLYDSLTNQKQTMYDVHFVDMGIRAIGDADLENFNLFKIYSTGIDKRFRFWRCELRGAQILSLHGTGNADLHRFEGCLVHAYKSFLELNNNQSVATETYSTDFQLYRDFIVLGEDGGGSFKQYGGNLEMHAHPTDTSDHFLFKDIGNTGGKMGIGNCDFLSSGVRYEIHGANKKLFNVDRLSADRPIVYTYDNAQFGSVSGGSRQAVFAKGLNLVVNFKNSILHNDFTFYGESDSSMVGGANAPVGVSISFKDCCAGTSLNLAPRCTLSGNKVRYVSDGTYKLPSSVNARASLDDFDYGWQTGVCSRSAAVKAVSLTVGRSTNGLGNNTPIDLIFPSGAYIKRLSIKAPAGTGTTPYKIHIGHKETNTIIASSAGTTIADAHNILVEDVGVFNFDLLSVWAVTDGSNYKLITATMDYI